MERWQAKVIALLVLFLTVLTATLLPIKVTNLFERQGERGARWISYLMCFGGGVFLSTFGLHMGPDVREIFQHAIKDPYGIDYPIAELTIFLGLFLMLYLDKVMDKVQKKQKKKKDAEGGGEQSSKKVQVTVNAQNGTVTKDSGDAVGRRLSETKSHDSWYGKPSLAESIPLRADSMGDSSENNSFIAATTTDSKANALDVPYEQKYISSIVDLSQDVIPEIRSPRSMLLLLALSLDHIFEGISVGLKHSITSVWSLTLAIIAHEVVIAFSLGMRLVKTCDSIKKILIAAVFCSAMEPIGVAIGMVLMETGSGDNHNVVVLNGVLQALATGVFMYATFFEILRDELHGNTSVMRLTFMLFGFTVLALMGLIPEESIFADDSSLSNTTDSMLSHDVVVVDTTPAG